jgi:putative transposase
VLLFYRSSHRYEATRDDQAVLRMRIREIAEARVRYGYFRIYILLRREGWRVNHKRVYRLYQKEGLSLRRKRPRRHSSGAWRVGRIEAGAANECWSMDFVSDALYDGRRLRVLTVVDDYTRECLAIEVDQGIGGEKVGGVLGRITMERRIPKTIRVDHGPEFVSKVLDQWAYRNGVILDFSRPGKPTDNAYIETFNGTLRAECLDTHWFGTMEEAKERIEAWRREYNESRPHRALGERTPNEFAHEIAAIENCISNVLSQAQKKRAVAQE